MTVLFRRTIRLSDALERSPRFSPTVTGTDTDSRIHPETGELWQAEIGPMGGDEVNILLPGHNYGWPLVSTGRNYTGTLVSDQPWSRPGMDNPRIHWVPSISPSSIMFYTGDKFPRWKNNLFVGALTTRQLVRVAFDQPSQAERREGLLIPMDIRPRDVQQSPDGYIYVVDRAGLRRQHGGRNGLAYRATTIKRNSPA